jgi:hypothetical protein
VFVKLIDTRTQQVVDATLFKNASVWHWTEGNGSCDCNRILEFQNVDEDLYMSEMGLEKDACLGKRRFLVLDVAGDLEGRDIKTLIQEANAGYI